MEKGLIGLTSKEILGFTRARLLAPFFCFVQVFARRVILSPMECLGWRTELHGSGALARVKAVL